MSSLTQLVDRSCHHRHDLVLDLDIGWYHKTSTTRGLPDSGGGSLQVGDRASGDGDVCAVLGEQHRGRGSDAGSASRDERNAAGEIEYVVVDH